MSITIGKAIGYLDLDTTGFHNGFKTALSDLKSFSDKTEGLSSKLTSLGSALTSAGTTLTKTITAPIVGIGASAVKTAADFESAMSNVKAISGATGDEMVSLTAKAEEMGAKTKFSASESAEAFKYMAMAGWKTEDMLAGIEGIMNLAAASGEDLGTTSDIVTDALTAFGLAAEDTQHFVDVLAKASNSSNTNVAMLGESFKYAAPVAGALGYSIDDVAVALGIMANNGIKASMAGTSLRQLITNMAKPTDSMATAMDYLGVSLEDTEGNVLPLIDVLEDFREAFNTGVLESSGWANQVQHISALLEKGKITEDEYNEEMERLIGNLEGVEGADRAFYAATIAGTRGMAALLSIVGTSTEDWEKLKNEIAAAGGTSEEMAKTQLDNLSGQLIILKSGIEGAAIAFGNLMMPAIKKAVEGIQGFVTWINNLDESQKELIVKIASVVAAIGPLLIVFGKVSSTIGKIIGLISGAGGLSGVLAAITGPIGIAIAAAAALAAAWATDFGGIREKTQEVMGSIQTIISSVMNIIKSIWENDLLGIQELAQDIWNTIAQLFEDVLNVIVDIFDVFAKLFSGDWEGLWESVKKLVEDVWNGILNFIGNILNFIVDAILAQAVAFYNAAKSVFEFLSKGASEVWNNFINWFNQAKEDPIGAILSIGSSMFEAGKSILNSVWEGAKSVWDSIVNWVNEKIQWLLDKIQFWKKKTNEMKKGEDEQALTEALDKAKDLDASERISRNIPDRISNRLPAADSGTTPVQQAPTTNNYIFNSPVAVTPTVAAKQMKQTAQQMALDV